MEEALENVKDPQNSEDQQVEVSPLSAEVKNTNEERPILESQYPTDEKSKEESKPFKKPVLLVGPRRGNVAKVKTLGVAFEQTKTIPEPDTVEDAKEFRDVEPLKKQAQPIPVQQEKQKPLCYIEPPWGGIPKDSYKFEVLKSGTILESIDISKKSYYVVGRLPICDIPLAHPTISRYHAIIQYRTDGDEKNSPGMYIYDLGSTHGTFWNGSRIKPNVYARIQDGHMVAFGCSQRKFIVQAPDDDKEEESEMTVTELREKRRLQLEDELRIRKEKQAEEEELEQLRKEEEEAAGVDWGMGEDADEETDLTENPFAQSNNEELFLDDPKKTLRGWFEREGQDLQYLVEDKGVGRFVCAINLPIDGSTGGPVRAEVTVTGKKKEAVVQCALEACRILDRQGLLRQATHEGRKKKSKNWEEDDYYDSDEDNFLDRTGTVEKKRMQRMKMAGKLSEKAETYETLMEKHIQLAEKIKKVEKTLALHKLKQDELESSTVDPLDAFMSSLSSPALDKSGIRRIKTELANLRKEETQLIKLINIAKPVNLPPLKPYRDKEIKDDFGNDKSDSPIKRPKLEPTMKSDLPAKKVFNIVINKKNIEPAQESGVVEKAETNKTEVERLAKSESSINNEEAGPTEKRKQKKRPRTKDKQDKPLAFDDSLRENYSTWVFPEDQSEDGRTSLNDKYGY